MGTSGEGDVLVYQFRAGGVPPINKLYKAGYTSQKVFLRVTKKSRMKKLHLEDFRLACLIHARDSGMARLHFQYTMLRDYPESEIENPSLKWVCLLHSNA